MLAEVFKAVLRFPVLQMKLFCDDAPMIGVQIDDDLANYDLCMDWKYYSVRILTNSHIMLDF